MSDPNFEHLKKEKHIIDIAKANGYGLLAFPVFTALYLVPYILVWGDRFKFSYIKENFNGIEFGIGTFSLFIILVVGIVLHELIHGITWAVFAKRGFKSIKFGFMVKMLTPYCHCKEPLKVKHYVLGAIMPAIILGFIPAIIAIAIGSFKLLLFAIFFSVAAIGDFMIIYLIRKEPKNSYIQDHPSEADYYVYKEE